MSGSSKWISMFGYELAHWEGRRPALWLTNEDFPGPD